MDSPEEKGFNKPKHHIFTTNSRAQYFLDLGILEYKKNNFKFAKGLFIQSRNEAVIYKEKKIYARAVALIGKCGNTGPTDSVKQIFDTKAVTGRSELTVRHAHKDAADATGTVPMPKKSIQLAADSTLGVYNIYDFPLDQPCNMESDIQNNIVQPMGYAIAIADGIFISARHIFNYLPVSACILYCKTGFYAFHLIEDGAANGMDYIIGKLIPMFQEEVNYPPSISLTMPPGASVTIALVHSIGFQTAQYDPTRFEKLKEVTTFETKQGFSGAAYIDTSGGMFALHCKRSESPLAKGWSYASIGLPIAMVAKNSKVLKLVDFRHIQIYDTFNVIKQDILFDHFSTAVSELDEIDEAGERDLVLGKTPTVKKWAPAVQAVLKRFFEKGKAEFIKQFNVKHNGTDYKWAIYVHLKKEDSNMACVILFKKNQKPPKALLEKALNSFKQKHPAVDTLIQDSTEQTNWRVKVYAKKDAKERTWVQLAMPNDTKNVIAMGHKIPANCFWNFGADSAIEGKSYKQNRIAQVKENKKGNGEPRKKPRTEDEIAEKVLKIQRDARFDAKKGFKIPGHQVYGTTAGCAYIQRFTKDEAGTNYTFQTSSYNSSQAGGERTTYRTFTNSAPKDFVWREISTRWSKSKKCTEHNYRLFPTADSVDFYCAFDNLTPGFMIKLSGEWVALTETSEVKWLKNSRATASTLMLDRMGTHFEIRVKEDGLTYTQNKQVIDLMSKGGRTVKFSDAAGFFHRKKEIKAKYHPTRTLNQLKKTVVALNTIMAT